MPEPRPSRSASQTYLFIALVAVELLMSFTFLGYLHVQPISITLAYIPPILAGCLLGPVQDPEDTRPEWAGYRRR